MALKNSLILQLMRFGIVGGTSATVHFSVVVFLVQITLLNPLIANVIGFFIALQVSYWGHRTWTFSGTTAVHSVAIPRLLVVYSTAFILNESMFYLFLVILNLPYMLALLIVLTTLPMLTFLFGKFWVFK
jgi:putative flippase GtrA